MEALILAVLTALVLVNADRENRVVELFLVSVVALIKIGIILN